jgi:hypothetical protein
MKKLTLTLFALIIGTTVILASGFNSIGKDNFKFSNFSSPKKISASNNFEQGKSFLSLGYGTPNLVFFWIDLDETTISNKKIGPIGVKYEYAVSDLLGIGITFNYNEGTRDYNDIFSLDSVYQTILNVKKFSFIPRLNFHFYHENNLDLYAGFGFGYRMRKTTVTSNDPNFDQEQYISNLYDSFNIPIAFEGTFGMRYFITENVGLYSEIGFAKAILQAGVVFSF